jgi:aspartate/methionine/tyrosine aminotransferase
MTTPEPAPAIVAAPRSGIRAIVALLEGRDDVINLTFGEPDFDTPAHIAEAGAAAIRAGKTRYAPGAGIMPLRVALARSVGARAGVELTPAHVAVAAGGVQAIFAALSALVEPGGGVLVPDPGWPVYAGQCTLLGLRAVPYRLDPAAGFEPDLVALETLAAAPGMRLLVLNNPGNPTGAVWSPATFAACLEIARRHGLWVISDEVYDELVFDGTHTPALALDTDGRVVVVGSFSKTYAMTGWRIGYAIARPAIAALLTKVLEYDASCVGTPAQHAAVAALDGPQDCVATMRDAYRGRRDLAVAALDRAGLLVAVPRGAFYAMVDISAATTDSTAFAVALATAPDGVACAPGAAFGDSTAAMVRLSLAASPAAISEGIRRVAAGVASWAATGRIG